MADEGQGRFRLTDAEYNNPVETLRVFLNELHIDLTVGHDGWDLVIEVSKHGRTLDRKLGFP